MHRYEVTVSLKGDPMQYRVIIVAKDVFMAEWLGLNKLFSIDIRYLDEVKGEED